MSGLDGLKSLPAAHFPEDVYEAQDQQGYIVEASLPGVKPEDISIRAMGDTVAKKCSYRMQVEAIHKA